MSNTIGLLPFFLNYRKDANLHLDLRIRLKVERALVYMLEIQAMHKEIARQIKNRNKKIARHVNKKRKNRS